MKFEEKKISVKNALISPQKKLLLHCPIPCIIHNTCVHGLPKNNTLKYTLSGVT